MSDNAIYTRNKAADIVDFIEDILIRNNIKVPSPEDDERDPEDDLGFYGTTYSDILDKVEGILIDLLRHAKPGMSVITDVFE